MTTKQSKEVKIQREVEKWLTSYDMEFVTQNESVNPEIDKALSKASTNLQDVDNAVGRYKEVVNLVNLVKTK